MPDAIAINNLLLRMIGMVCWGGVHECTCDNDNKDGHANDNDAAHCDNTPDDADAWRNNDDDNDNYDDRNSDSSRDGDGNAYKANEETDAKNDYINDNNDHKIGAQRSNDKNHHCDNHGKMMATVAGTMR